ncbi:MAG: TetR/AcrR family transcriptional regulator [Spirochaetales bacterium]|nr:TetR/AcrR family transcriptional regulator [Spirochaetales bacterium]
MGRPFNEDEKEAIKNNLLEKGRALFVKKGLKNTTIEELTQSSGIAQGSFYAFYGSKEELYFEILESEEKQISQLIEKQLLSFDMTRRNFKKFLFQTIELITGNPLLISLLNVNDYQAMISKIPDEKLQEHLRKEYKFTDRLIYQFQKEKYMKHIRPEILSGLLYALFLLQLHRDEIGTGVFTDMFEFLIDIISDTLINNGMKNFNETEDDYSK